MKTFLYTFHSNDGKTIDGKVKANSLQQARSYLKRKKLKILSIKEEKESLFKRLTEDKMVGADELVAFSHLFAGCIRTGLSVKESLSLLGKQIDNKLLQNCLSEIIIDIESGTPMSAAFLKQNEVFPKFYSMLIRAGEASGDLASVLEYLGSYLEKINDIKKEVKSVITYPSIVLLVGIVLLVVILLFVAPVFKDVFSASKKALPIPTVLLFFFSSLIRKHLYILIILFSGIGLLLFLTYKSKKWRPKYHYLFLTMPIFGKLVREVALLQFLRAFDILINNDVPILQALQVLEEGTSNLKIREVITEIRRDVSRGLPIAGPLIANQVLISSMIAHTIAMGEKAGNLGKTLSRTGEYIDKEVGYSLKKLSSRLDPILTFSIGMMVLFIALAIYLPIFDMMAVVR